MLIMSRFGSCDTRTGFKADIDSTYGFAVTSVISRWALKDTHKAGG